jgi:hypothetical protein
MKVIEAKLIEPTHPEEVSPERRGKSFQPLRRRV